MREDPEVLDSDEAAEARDAAAMVLDKQLLRLMQVQLWGSPSAVNPRPPDYNTRMTD